MKYNAYAFVWDTIELVWRATGINLSAPVSYFWPGFGPWLFGKMIGCEGKRIK